MEYAPLVHPPPSQLGLIQIELNLKFERYLSPFG